MDSEKAGDSPLWPEQISIEIENFSESNGGPPTKHLNTTSIWRSRAMSAEKVEMADYLRRISGYRLLEADEEIELAREVRDSRAGLDRLARQIPWHLRPALPRPSGDGTIEWTFEAIRDFRVGLKRRSSLSSNGASSRIHEFVVQADRFERARRALVEGNLRLVVHLARQRWDDGFGVIDMIQEGNLGLMKAVERFDHRRGNRFSTYAYWWITQAIERALKEKRRLVRLPSNVEDVQRRARRVAGELSIKLGRKPNPEEVGEVLGISGRKVTGILQLAQRIESVDTGAGAPEGLSWLDNIEDKKGLSPYRQLELRDIVSRVEWMLAQLTPREQRVLRLRFGIGEDRGMSLEEIGRETGVSRERVRQIVLKTLVKLRRWTPGLHRPPTEPPGYDGRAPSQVDGSGHA